MSNAIGHPRPTPTGAAQAGPHIVTLLYLLDIQISTSDQHGDFKSKEREPVSTLDSPRSVPDG